MTLLSRLLSRLHVRRSLGLAGALVVLLVGLAALLPVPYVLLSPGPTTNTLGSVGGKQLITISGRRTYPDQGHLDLTTVSVSGGPGSSLTLVRAVAGWLDRRSAVVPEEAVYPKGETAQQIEQENAQEMELSQQYATAAALRDLHIPVRQTTVIQAVAKDAPSGDQLEAGDVLLSIDGTTIRKPADVRTAITRHRPGETVALRLRRDGAVRDVSAGTHAGPDGKAVVGIVPAEGFAFPFAVDISLEHVGGPSAGLMFALGIEDKLTPGSLTGGRYVAGTGTIDAGGEVGPIGGISQKIAGARSKGATVFLAPAGNCAEAVRAAPAGLTLIKVSTLRDARASLDALRAGRRDLPSCTG